MARCFPRRSRLPDMPRCPGIDGRPIGADLPAGGPLALLWARPGPSPINQFDQENAAMKVCFVGLGNLPVLAPEYNHHGIGGEQVQQTLLAKALAARGYQVSMVVGDYGQFDGACWHCVTTYKTYRADSGLP